MAASNDTAIEINTKNRDLSHDLTHSFEVDFFNTL